MENGNIVYVRKRSALWKLVKFVLAIAAIAFVAAKVYQKFLKPRIDAMKIEAAEDEELLLEEIAEGELLEAEEADEETFEVSADAVIANAEDME